ncbi:hypothetical protein TYRP_016050 [Tyrophagus putrescentiae]|nr:hypothetical protein TYRP_016050 [Tyrophagus putrescentiae]
MSIEEFTTSTLENSPTSLQLNFTIFLNELAPRVQLSHRFNHSELVLISKSTWYYQKLSQLLQETSPMTVHNYLGFKLVESFVGEIESDKMLKYYSWLNNQTKAEKIVIGKINGQNWEICLENPYNGWGTSRLYVDHFVSQELKTQAEDLANHIMAPPFFDSTYPLALIYGNTGATIGHEIVHHFDNYGIQITSDGTSYNWNIKEWAETRKRFNEKTKCFVDQYDVIVDRETGLGLNGKCLNAFLYISKSLPQCGQFSAGESATAHCDFIKWSHNVIKGGRLDAPSDVRVHQTDEHGVYQFSIVNVVKGHGEHVEDIGAVGGQLAAIAKRLIAHNICCLRKAKQWQPFLLLYHPCPTFSSW